MTNCRKLLLSALLLVASCSSNKEQKVTTLTDSSLGAIFEQLMEKTNPFEFYKSVYENFRFELKSTVIQSNQTEDAPPLESVSIYESNDKEESRFYKKSLDPISEVEWNERDGKDYIRYDDSKNSLRTSYNPIFEKWKRGMFEDIQDTFNLSELEKKSPKKENLWTCYEADQQKICVDSKTGLPVFGKAIKKLKAETAVSMVFSLSYGQDAVPAAKQPPPAASPAPKPSKQKPKKQALQKKK